MLAKHLLPKVTVLLTVAAVACGPSTPESHPADSTTPAQTTAAAWFEESAVDAGLDFVHVSGHRDAWWMPEIMSGGAAWLDFDDDGDLDAYLVQGGRFGSPDAAVANRLYENVGEGRFREVPPTGNERLDGARDSGYGMGVATGDVDGDGDVDLYVTNVGRNTLLLNQGSGHFTDATDGAGVGDPGWGSSAAFFDFDRDGDLDLMVSNYLRWSPQTEIPCQNDRGGEDYCSPQSYDAPVADVLYENRGDGTFRDISETSGISHLAGTGLGVVATDFDGDGWLDVFVANDGMPDRLWINQRNGRFEDRALIAGCALDRGGKAKAGMGVSVADIDRDGDPDLLVGNLNTESDSLFLNQAGTFTDATARLGMAAVSRPFTRFGMAWIDFDADGFFDLYQANGRVTRHGPAFGDDPFAEPNLLFRGTPDLAFVEVEPRGGTTPSLAATSRAAAFGDYDNDGAVDVLVVNRDGPVHLLRNVARRSGHWMLLDVRNRRGAPALGATVTFRLGEGQHTYAVRSAYSYQAANDPRVHLGLGVTDSLSAVEVTWTDGETTTFGPLEGDRVHRLQRP